MITTFIKALPFVLLFCIGNVLVAAPSESMLKQLGRRAAEGNLDAIDKLVDAKKDLYKGIDYRNEPERVRNNALMMRAAFAEISKAVISGNEKAYTSLEYAVTKHDLESWAATALGEVAAKGHKKALNVLIEYKTNGIPKSTAVRALHTSAEKMIPEAVEFMIQIIEDEKSKALWGPAADSLGSAAARGNIRAKAAIDKFKEEVESRKKGQDTKP